ncbi:MAG: helix-turn-helix domain-containing protein [Candidatus Bathyarchaeia archaeon]
MEIDFQRGALVSPRPLLKYLKTFLGLSEYEAKIYEFLVNEEPSTARKISLRCGIPRTKVYCVLRRLVEQNIIAEAPLKPRLFVALPPSKGVKTIYRDSRKNC